MIPVCRFCGEYIEVSDRAHRGLCSLACKRVVQTIEARLAREAAAKRRAALRRVA